MIKLTREDGQPLYVRKEDISHFTAPVDGPVGAGAEVFVAGHMYYIKETPEQLDSFLTTGTWK